MSDLIGHDRNKDGAIEFIDAVVHNEPIWPNPWGQDVAFCAFKMHTDTNRIAELEALRTEHHQQYTENFTASSPVNSHSQEPKGREWLLQLFYKPAHKRNGPDIVAGCSAINWLFDERERLISESMNRRKGLGVASLIPPVEQEPVAYEVKTINNSYLNPAENVATWLTHNVERFKNNCARCLEVVEIKPLVYATPISPTPSGHYKDALIEDLDNRKEVTPSQQEAKPKAGETWYILHQDARACRTVTIAEITEATVLFEPERYVSSGERVPLNRVKFIELARPD